MDTQTLNTLAKLDAPPAVVERLVARDEQIAAIRAARYVPEKERAEVGRIREAHAHAEAEALRGELAAIDAERSQALAQLDREIAAANALPTDPAALATVGITETRRARVASLAAMDVALVAQSTDPARIAAVALSALEQDVESGLRVAAAAEARLFHLAAEAQRAARNDQKPSQALAQVKAAVSPIEQRAHAASPQARRAAIEDAAERRKMSIRTRVHNAAQLGNFAGAIDPFMLGLGVGGGR